METECRIKMVCSFLLQKAECKADYNRPPLFLKQYVCFINTDVEDMYNFKLVQRLMSIREKSHANMDL